MKRLFYVLICSAFSLLVSSQIPEGFNYQALAADAAGTPVRNTDLQAKFTILSDTVNPVIIWEELHSAVRTNSNGLFSVVLGSGTIQPSSLVTSFREINWSSFTAYLKTHIYYQGSWKTMGTSRLWSVPYAMTANNLAGSIPNLLIEGNSTDQEEPLFEVRNKEGQTVFAVYNEGVRIYVDDGAKGKKGGFAIGGFGSSKESSQDLFIVNNDSIRAYIDPTSVKGKKGGFSIGGFAGSKGSSGDYLNVNADSTIFYVRKDSINQSSSFDIIALGQNLGQKSLLTANPDTVNITGVLSLQNDLVVGGDIAVEGSINQVTDIEGNIYKTVKIGTQVWMADNLKTTKYNDGTLLTDITSDAGWAALNTGAYCLYNNDATTFKGVYGNLYNWYAIDVAGNGGKNICPTGWHVATDPEWTIITDYLGGVTSAGKLKEKGTTHWTSPNTGATNESGFTSLPGGKRDSGGGFADIGNAGWFWTSSSSDLANAFIRAMWYNNVGVDSTPQSKNNGYSVRCLKDN
ncbi:MAG TPA: fibrobacter succinogenes major paralogous domain-containing protein [Bacteroidales bacterium]|nr:fibrobacter succinogenes major paralogous domain-containing protein [Bacteroidales bacterium]